MNAGAAAVPSLDGDAAAALLSDRWGITGALQPLGSHEDVNFLVEVEAEETPASRPTRYVLKVTSPATAPGEVEAQAAGMLRLALAGLPFDTPVPVAATDGSLAIDLDLPVGRCIARVLTWVEGDVLAGWPYLAPPVLRALGDVAGRTAAALAGLEHPALDRPFTWDCRRCAEVAREQASSVADPGRRALALATVERADRALEPWREQLRMATIHGDVTDLNVLARAGADGRPTVCGLIDVGDLSTGWLVGEAAVAACSAVGHAPTRPLPAIAEVVAGFDAACRLTDVELAALWWVLLGRAAVLATSAEHQAALDPGNEYVTSSLDQEWRNLETLAAVPAELAHEALRLACGRQASGSVPLIVPSPAVAIVDVAPGPILDLSVTSDLLAPGSWEDPPAVAATIAHAGVAAIGRHGEARLLATDPTPDEPATVTLGVELTCPAATAVRAPLDGEVRWVEGDRVAVHVGSGLDVVLGGVVPIAEVGAPVAAGDPVGRVADHDPASPWPSHVHVVAVAAGVVPPLAVPASLADAWLALCPDPSPLLGLDPGAALAARPDPAALLARRAAVLAEVQEHYWTEPPSIERGWGTRLFATTGRPYLDAVNNVAVLGHSHPAVTDAVTSQLRHLNTNSRFHYEAIVAYAERLAGLCPEPLDTVLLVSTGSEACDLALRLVQAATGRQPVIALHGAYHGWTTATDAVSTSVHDNPTALGTRPPWVHLVEAPDPYRGRFRGPDAGERYAADVERVVADLAATGEAPAGFISEPLSGNAGGMVLPEGYLTRAYAAVRAAGGLCIADEVQTGLGRLGDWFWAFESQGVVPDVVTVAKAAGNGLPVGAVITTRAIADALRSQGSFFSSVGGSPVSAAAGLAVLDTIEAEGLQENARVVGGKLRGRLEELVDRFPLAGAVHGIGLYLGLELVRDGGTREPATAVAAAICERALELGVIVQPTGDGANVLKIKPPLCFSEADADLLADTLASVLADGW